MSVKLTSGNDMPILGLGTARITDPATKETLERLLGEKVYLHLDTASMYANEELLGDVLQDLFKRKLLERKDIFVTTKVAVYELNEVEAALHRSLKRLKLDYVDQYLLHGPWAMKIEGESRTNAKVPVHEQWAAMEKVYHQGLAKSIGVSNFNFQLLNDLLSYAKVPPAANQIELHPYLVQSDFVAWLKENKIVPVAYSPLGRGEIDGKEGLPLHDPVIHKIAARHNRTPAQVIIAWHVARGHVVIPKSSNYDRAKQNAEGATLKLSPEEVAEITGLNQNRRLLNTKVIAEFFKLHLPIFD